MRIKCEIACRVTTMNTKTNTETKNVSRIATYEANAYEGDKNFKVEFRLEIYRVSKGKNAELLAGGDWFIKGGMDKFFRWIDYAGVRFVYDLVRDIVYIETNTIIV